MTQKSLNGSASDLATCTRKGAIAVIELNRPERHNSLVPEFLEALLLRLREVRDSDAAAVVLQAAGRSFCTGGDLHGFLAHWEAVEDYGHALVGALHEAVLALAELPQPVVGAVQGWVTGGGLGLVLGCDLVLLAEDARFAPFYVDVGFSPDGGWATLLPEFIGHRRAAELQLCNRTLEAEAAVQYGLGTRVVRGDVREQALEVAGLIAGKVDHSVRSTKRLLNRDLERWRQGLEAERRAFVECIARPGVRERVERFIGTM